MKQEVIGFLLELGIRGCPEDFLCRWNEVGAGSLCQTDRYAVKEMQSQGEHSEGRVHWWLGGKC